MKRELPADGRRTTLSVERRMATHARTTQAPDPEPGEPLAREMDRERPAPVRVDRRRAARRARLRDRRRARRPSPRLRRGGARLEGRPRCPSGSDRWRPPHGCAAGSAASRRPPAPFIVGVNRSGTTLLRLMLDSHPQLTIPPETHFVPEMIRLARRENTTRKRLAAGCDRPSRAGATSGSTSAVLLERLQEVKPLNPRRRDPRLLRPLRREGGQAALGRQDAALHAGDAADRARPPRGPLHPPDPRRPRRRPLAGRACPGGRGADDHRGRRALAAADRDGPRALRRPRRLPRGPLRGPGRRSRGAPCAGSASSSSSPTTPRCSTTTSAPPSG